jgi:hypothetical protein
MGTYANPRHNATQVGAHGVEAVLLNGTILSDNQVGGVTLHATADNHKHSVHVS